MPFRKEWANVLIGLLIPSLILLDNTLQDNRDRMLKTQINTCPHGIISELFHWATILDT